MLCVYAIYIYTHIDKMFSYTHICISLCCVLIMYMYEIKYLHVSVYVYLLVSCLCIFTPAYGMLTYVCLGIITSKPLNSLFVKLMRTVQTIYIFAD